jgi:hypothetical protein
VVLAVPRTAPEGDVSGFITLARGTDRRRIPLWFRIERPQLPRDRRGSLVRTGDYTADTARGAAHVTSYRYPEARSSGFPVRLPGREVVFRVRVSRPANFGVAVTGRDARVRVEPRIVRNGDENRLAGYTALPLDVNPYRASYGRHRLVAGVVLPAPGTYDIVFDTPSAARPGGFRFRYWVGDTQPPLVRVLGVRGRHLELSITDRGSGVDPQSLDARVDGDRTPVSFSDGVARVPASRGRHVLNFSVADYQETKNMEDVARIRPNTRTIRASFTVR